MVTKSQVACFFLCLVVLALLGLVGNMDYTDAELEHARYCKMVDEHIWPDYRHIYHDECRVPFAKIEK